MADSNFILYDTFETVNAIDPINYGKYNVKRGLRNADGTGVVTGLTNIANVHGYNMVDGEKIPDQGILRYRGYNVADLLANDSPDQRFSYEEVSYLLLTGELPSKEQLEGYVAAIDEQRDLPDGFCALNLMHETPNNVMNLLSRAILQLYVFDENAESRDPKHEIDTAISIISRLPRIAVLSYFAVQAKYNNGSMIIHPFIPRQSTAETILSMLRLDRQFTPEEARMLDVMLCLHAEHGGGNNSTFATRVLSSSDTDPYSTYSAAIGSLKGYRHGGANHKVVAMQKEIEANVANWQDEGQVADYLTKILRKEAFDGSGLVYGMGHAVYTLSDPRAVICKRFARRLAEGTEFQAEFELLETIERITPELFLQEKGSNKKLCANVDMYSGFVYKMLGIPEELFTPLFVCGRISGWAAHRFEEIVSSKRIIRPAYKALKYTERAYTPLEAR